MTHPEAAVAIPITYHRQWPDGFAARGWKLDVSIGEPSVIAATAEHGKKIPTSVLVHDILDHHLCGFGIGGHRNEAMALIQLASRTGSDPAGDYAQIIDEDLMQGHCNGEPLYDFLPDDLKQRLPETVHEGKAVIEFLAQNLGTRRLKQRLIQQFFDIGHAATPGVQQHWRSMGLDYANRAATGLALQQILTAADAYVLKTEMDEAHGSFIIGNGQSRLELVTPETITFE